MQPMSSNSESTFRTGEISGIRGWLLLAAISLVTTALGQLILTWGTISIAFGERQPALEAIFPNLYAPAMRTMHKVDVLTAIPLILASVTVLSLFFRKKRSAPKVVIAFLCVSEVRSYIFVFWEWAITGEQLLADFGLLSSFINVFIWIPYFCVSLRVSNTFVRD